MTKSNNFRLKTAKYMVAGQIGPPGLSALRPAELLSKLEEELVLILLLNMVDVFVLDKKEMKYIVILCPLVQVR